MVSELERQDCSRNEGCGEGYLARPIPKNRLSPCVNALLHFSTDDIAARASDPDVFSDHTAMSRMSYPEE
jgi:hypothetical protein